MLPLAPTDSGNAPDRKRFRGIAVQREDTALNLRQFVPIPTLLGHDLHQSNPAFHRL
jgi:hypothetical protein